MNTSWLEKILNVVLIVTCVLVSGVAVKRLTQDAAPAAPDPRVQPQGYTKGEVLPPIAGVRYAEREKTVVLFISSHCKYCVESMPFYARLSNLRKSAGFQLVVVSSEATKTITDLLAENRCEADHVKTIGPDDLKVFATPTLIVADRQGRVSNVWRGALRQREREVEEALSGVGGA